MDERERVVKLIEALDRADECRERSAVDAGCHTFHVSRRSAAPGGCSAPGVWLRPVPPMVRGML